MTILRDTLQFGALGVAFILFVMGASNVGDIQNPDTMAGVVYLTLAGSVLVFCLWQFYRDDMRALREGRREIERTLTEHGIPADRAAEVREALEPLFRKLPGR